MSNKTIEEISSLWYGTLICPNPREHYKNTRSFEQMRLEYDLTHCHEITEEDVELIALRLRMVR